MPNTINQSANPELAWLLYEKYCEAVGGVAFNGDPLPKWAEFAADANKTKQVAAWREVAELSKGLHPAKTAEEDEAEQDVKAGWHQVDGGTQALEFDGLGVIIKYKGYGMVHLPNAKLHKGSVVHINY